MGIANHDFTTRLNGPEQGRINVEKLEFQQNRMRSANRYYFNTVAFQTKSFAKQVDLTED